MCFLLVSVWIGATGSAPVTAQMSASALPVPPGSTTSAASVPLTVIGQVISATTSSPVARALVRLNDRAVLSDHEGKFEFRDFTATQMNNLQVSKPGYYASADSMEAGALNLRSDQLAQHIEVRLYPEALLTGTVTRPDGTPLPHISVTARRSVYNDQVHRWIPSGQTSTDSRGNFRLPVPAGDYKIETGYNPHESGTSEAVLPISFPVVNESNTSGLVHVTSGAQEHFDLRPPLSRTYGVNVAIDSSLERGLPMITARSGSGLTIPAHQSGRPTGPGQMRLELPSGSYTLVATQNSQDMTLYGEAGVVVPDHDVDGVVLRLASVAPVPVELVIDSGATSDKSLPSVQQFGLTLESTQDSTQPEGAMVGLMAVREGGASFRAMPGTYRLQARGTGPWYIKSASYGTTDLLDKELTVSAGASGEAIRITASNQTGSLKGSTTLNGAMASCWLYLIPTGPSATGVFSSRSSSDGSYNFPYLPPGSYRAIAFEQRYSTNYRDPAALEKFATHVGTVSVSAGNKASLDLEAVPAKEMFP